MKIWGPRKGGMWQAVAKITDERYVPGNQNPTSPFLSADSVVWPGLPGRSLRGS